MKRIAFLAILLTYGCGGGADPNTDYVDAEITTVEGEVETKRAEIAVQDEALAVIEENRREFDAAPESDEKTDELTEMSYRETEVLDIKQILESELDALMQRQAELGLERDRIQAEIEARKKAEEARVLAEAEAQRVAEEDALAAEDETRRHAEAEAQRQADEEVRIKADKDSVRTARQEIVDQLGEASRQLLKGSKSFGEVAHL